MRILRAQSEESALTSRELVISGKVFDKNKEVKNGVTIFKQ